MIIDMMSFCRPSCPVGGPFASAVIVVDGGGGTGAASRAEAWAVLPVAVERGEAVLGLLLAVVSLSLPQFRP